MDQTPTFLPLSWHTDGTPIFERGDLIRQSRPLAPYEQNEAVIYDDLILPEHKHLRPELRLNLIVIQSSAGTLAHHGYIGQSEPDPRHASVYPRLIQALDSTCRVILQRHNEPDCLNDFILFTLQPLQLIAVPPTYQTVLTNSAESSPARFLELQAREESRGLDLLKQQAGPGYHLKTAGGFQANEKYRELPVPRIRPGLDDFRFLQRRPIYEMLTAYPKGFDFIDPPRPEFFTGAI